MSKNQQIEMLRQAEEFWKKEKNETKEKAQNQGINLKQWQVVYKTIDRWSYKKSPKEALRFVHFLAETSKYIQEDFKKAARAVEQGTHEQINSAEQSYVLIKIALGEFKTQKGKFCERVAKRKDGKTASITNIAEKHRIKTVEFLTKPVPAEKIENTKKWKLSDTELKKHVLTGHSGAAYFYSPSKKKPSQLYQIVSQDAGSKTGIHAEQLAALHDSSHHLSLSRRLSKKMDKYQENGDGILAVYFDGGEFHPYSNWHGFHIESPLHALVVAIKARHCYKTRKTNEKALRKPYADTASISESYTEISTESETCFENYKNFVEKTLSEDQYQDFIEQQNIDITSTEGEETFYQKLDELDKKLYGNKDKGRGR